MERWLWEAPRFKQKLVTQPAAGADWTTTFNDEGNVRLWYLRALLATSGVAGARSPRLNLGDGTNVFYTCRPSGTVSTNINAVFSGAIGDPGAGANSNTLGWSMPGPGLFIPRGWSLTTLTASIDVGDQWSGIAMWLEILPDGPDNTWLPEPRTRVEERL